MSEQGSFQQETEGFIGGCGIVLIFGCAFWVSRKEPRLEFQWATSSGECRRNADSEVYLHKWNVLVLKSRLGIWIQTSLGRNVKYSDC